MKFKNYIETESGIKDTSTSPGAAGQVLSSTVSGTSWIDQSTLVSGSAERVSILVKNGEGTALVKGDPVYIIGSVGASARLEVGLCDASDPSKMPCVGLLEQDLLNNGEGTAVTAGKLRNLITTPIDGQPTTENDTIYVKAGGSSGLALTTTKPTGSTNLIQNVGQVGRVSASSDGNFVVSAIMRTNDVPNLPTGKIWVGDGNTTVSTVVHLDETNGRMGVGTASPSGSLHIQNGASGQTNPNNIANGLIIETSSSIGAGMSILSPSSTSGNIFFGDESDNYVGGFRYYHNVNEMSINVNDAEALRINSLRNVGIGTTSPDSKLEVASTDSNTYLHVRNDSTGSTRLKMSNLSDTNSNGFQIINNGSNGQVNLLNYKASTLALWTNTSQRMTILSNGNIGIGTTSPRAKLHVEGVTGSVPALGAAASAAQIGGSTYGTLFSTLTSGTGVIQQGRSDGNTLTFPLLINPNGGNVGIGTTSPAQKLHVVGNSEITGDIYLGRYIFHNDDTNTWLGFPTSDTITFRTAGSDRVRITSIGNVGVGTASPSYKLDVTGEGRFTGDLRCLSLIQTSQRDQKTEIELVGKETTSIPIRKYKYKSGDNDKLRYGVVAEDIESNYPELVETDAEGVKGIKYIDLLVRKIAEIETEKRTLVNWRHFHSNTSYNTLYDTGMTTAFPYAYGSIPAPYDMYFTSFTLINNPYSSYNKGPEGDTASVQAYVNGRLIHEVREIRYGNNPYESITVDFGQNVSLRQGEALQIRFQANGPWRYCNSTIILTEK